jgi:hypothetical protein
MTRGVATGNTDGTDEQTFVRAAFDLRVPGLLRGEGPAA